MAEYAALLRGINVSGKHKLPMKELKALCEGLGWADVQTYIQSGNVCFRHETADVKALGAVLSGTIREQYGYEVPVLVRDAAALHAIWAGNPFLHEAGVLPEHLHFSLLESPPAQDAVQKLLTYDYPPDRIAVTDACVYLHTPGGYGNTKYHNAFLESKLKVAATTRNLNTMRELLRMLGMRL